jgi:hypothetical protein
MCTPSASNALVDAAGGSAPSRTCSPGPGADVAAVRPVPVQMWRPCARSRCRCGLLGFAQQAEPAQTDRQTWAAVTSEGASDSASPSAAAARAYAMGGGMGGS